MDRIEVLKNAISDEKEIIRQREQANIKSKRKLQNLMSWFKTVRETQFSVDSLLPKAKQERVYCSECKFFNHKTFEKIGETTTRPVNIKRCLYPENVGTWENPDELRNEPKDINRNCDCTWFERK